MSADSNDSMSNADVIEVHIIAPTIEAAEELRATVPLGTSARRLAMDYFREQKQSMCDGDGGIMRPVVHLVSPQGDEYPVPLDVEINKAGVRDGDTLHVFLEEVAEVDRVIELSRRMTALEEDLTSRAKEIMSKFEDTGRSLTKLKKRVTRQRKAIRKQGQTVDEHDEVVQEHEIRLSRLEDDVGTVEQGLREVAKTLFVHTTRFTKKEEPDG